MNGEHLGPKGGFQGRPGPEGGGRFIDHHEGRQTEVHHLQGQVEVALDVGGIEDQQQAVGPLSGIEQGVAGHGFVEGLGVEAVRAGQVDQFDVRVAFDGRRGGGDGHPRQVGHLGPGAGELVEQGGFPAIRVADQSQFHRAIHWAGSRGALPFASQISRWALGPSPRSMTVPTF